MIPYRHKYDLTLKDEKMLMYMNMLSMALIINIFSINYWLLIRFSYYFYQFTIFLIPNSYESLKLTNVEKRNLKIILIIFAIFFVVFSGENTYYAYHTVFNKNMQPAYLDDYIKLYE